MRWSFAVALVCVSSPAFAYNSEEHKLIGDTGSSLAKTCTILTAPGADANLFKRTASGCQVFGKLGNTKSEKPLLKTYDGAPGPTPGGRFEPSLEPDLVTAAWQAGYKQWALESNETYKEHWDRLPYYSGDSSKDEEYNDIILIPVKQDAALQKLKPLVVWVGAADGEKGAYFTFGDLVALYGDFRKIVTCDAKATHDCTLTDGGPPGPDKADTVHKYLRAFAHGATPPIGDLGQTLDLWELNDEGKPLYDNLGWWGDELMRLANVNDAHFSDRAVAWYVAMHRLALRHAMLAAKSGDPTYLWQAIHHEANGLHSITDLFSPGHVIMHRALSADGIWDRSHPKEEKNALRDWRRSMLDLGTLGDVSDAHYDGIKTPSSSYLNVSAGLTIWGLRAKWEESGHASFNKNGAEARNLKGTVFKVFGDSRLLARKDPEAAEPSVNDEDLYRTASTAVKEGLNSVLEAYALMKKSGDVDAAYRSLEAKRSTYFRALLHIPTEIRRACYGRREFCYGPGASERDWRGATYRDGVIRFLGASAGGVSRTLPHVDGRRWVIDPLYIGVYGVGTVLDSFASLWGGRKSLAYALQSGDTGYQFDEGETKLVCEDFGLDVYEFTVDPRK